MSSYSVIFPSKMISMNTKEKETFLNTIGNIGLIGGLFTKLYIPVLITIRK